MYIAFVVSYIYCCVNMQEALGMYGLEMLIEPHRETTITVVEEEGGSWSRQSDRWGTHKF